MTRDDPRSRNFASRRTIIRTGLGTGLSVAGLAAPKAADEQKHGDGEQPEEDEQAEEGDERSEDGGQSEGEPVREEDEQAAETADPAAEIAFSDHETSGGSVTVDRVFMEEGGFVSIHDRRRFDGQVLGSIIGITDFLEPGSHSGVSVPLFTANATAPGPGDGQDASGLVENQPLIAIPHLDGNDSGSFDGEPDPAYRNGPRTLDQFGAVNDYATVSVAGADPEEAGPETETE